MSSTLKGAVVGCRMGGGHARAMESVSEYDLVALCDLNAETAGAVCEKLGRKVNVYTDYAEMLAKEKPDVVAVATPNSSHEALTIQAARAGVKGVCAEKPMAMDLGQARAMVAACREHGTALFVNHQRRLNSDLVTMRRLMEEGAIGEVQLIRATNAGDVLSDGTHAVDSVRHLAGDRPIKWLLGQVYRLPPNPDEDKAVGYHVSGGYRYGHPVEDGAMATWEFDNGVRGELLTGAVRFPGRPYQDYEVLGTEGRLWRPGDKGEIFIQDGRAKGWQPVALDPVEPANPIARAYQLFAETIRTGAVHPLSGDSALQDQEVVMAVYESARLRARIDMPPAQDRFPLQVMVDEGVM